MKTSGSGRPNSATGSSGMLGSRRLGFNHSLAIREDERKVKVSSKAKEQKKTHEVERIMQEDNKRRFRKKRTRNSNMGGCGLE